MYKSRLKVLIALCIAAAVICLFRLSWLQLVNCRSARKHLKDMQILPPQQLPTLRGAITDRFGRILAKDSPAFYLHCTYQWTRLADPRFWQGRITARTNAQTTPEQAEEKLKEEYAADLANLARIIQFAARIRRPGTETIHEQITELNNRIWEMGRYIYWRRTHPDDSMQIYRLDRDSIQPEDIVNIDLVEMHKTYPLIELSNPEDLLAAQMELADLSGVEIRPEAKRMYPYGTAACQLLGWVAPVHESEKDLFAEDEYMAYIDGELIGKGGIEQACEPMLRGRRGKVIYDKDGNELERIDPEFGRDVRLSLDIELQRQIEEYLLHPGQNPRPSDGSAAVVMDVATGDILAAASIPLYNLNTVRQRYMELISDPNRPMIHKALQTNYPPGSTVKPLILIAGMEEKKISAQEAISCPATSPPRGWPSCLAQSRFHNPHDWKWDGQGGNIARNAIRGSCNIYFSRLADRLDSADLQAWLYRFGYGRQILPGMAQTDLSDESERFCSPLPQAHGSIIYGIQPQPFERIDEITPIASSNNFEKRYWGIGQGNLRVTPLQAANALSAVVRDGIYKAPRLVLPEDDPFYEADRRNLGVSPFTMSVVKDGMHAAVNEVGGTGYSVFGDDPLSRELKIYGKTGSTENPEIAWFECFASDNAGRSIVVVVTVPGGQAGSTDAAPLGKDILYMVHDAGHIGLPSKN